MNQSASAFFLLSAPYRLVRFLARDDSDPPLLREVCLLLLPPPELLLPELLMATVVLLADTLLRVREPLVVLLAVFMGPLTIWLRELELLLRALVERVLEPLDFVILDAALFLPVLDRALADFPLVDLGLLILPAFLLIVLLAILSSVMPVVLLEVDEVGRLLRIFIPSLSPLPIACMAASSIPNSSAM